MLLLAAAAATTIACAGCMEGPRSWLWARLPAAADCTPGAPGASQLQRWKGMCLALKSSAAFALIQPLLLIGTHPAFLQTSLAAAADGTVDDKVSTCGCCCCLPLLLLHAGRGWSAGS